MFKKVMLDSTPEEKMLYVAKHKRVEYADLSVEEINCCFSDGRARSPLTEAVFNSKYASLFGMKKNPRENASSDDNFHDLQWGSKYAEHRGVSVKSKYLSFLRAIMIGGSRKEILIKYFNSYLPSIEGVFVALDNIMNDTSWLILIWIPSKYLLQNKIHKFTLRKLESYLGVPFSEIRNKIENKKDFDLNKLYSLQL